MRRLVFDADPFCYGPISTTLNPMDYLRKNIRLHERYCFTPVSTGTSLELPQASDGEQLARMVTFRQEAGMSKPDLQDVVSKWMGSQVLA